MPDHKTFLATNLPITDMKTPSEASCSNLFLTEQVNFPVMDSPPQELLKDSSLVVFDVMISGSGPKTVSASGLKSNCQENSNGNSLSSATEALQLMISGALSSTSSKTAGDTVTFGGAGSKRKSPAGNETEGSGA